MASAKPVDLCTHLLPSGKLCRGIALRGERLCRSHIRNHRILERERAHQQAMDRLAAELDVLDLPELLLALNEKLSRITSIVRAYPEARLALVIALQRLEETNEQNAAESDTFPQNDSNQFAGFNPS